MRRLRTHAHENQLQRLFVCLTFCIGIAIGIESAIDEHSDSDPDTDSDPENSRFPLYFRNNRELAYKFLAALVKIILASPPESSSIARRGRGTKITTKF